jgi:hypothetical protein
VENSIISGNISTGTNKDLYNKSTDGGTKINISFSIIGDKKDDINSLHQIPNANNHFEILANLGLLSDNGGATLTHLPLGGLSNPIIDGGVGVGPAPQDQRGADRTQGASIDIGSVESQPPSILPAQCVATPDSG